MAIVRITTAPAEKKDKPHKYLNLDIHKKNSKYLKTLKIVSIICIISVILNIYFLTR